MKVVIVGAEGLVGGEFARQLSAEHQVLPLSHRDLDITDADAISKIIFVERPSLIINCAVLGVDACEIDSSLAWSVNVVGAENLAKSAADIDAEFLQLSTNYVFDGNVANDYFYTMKDMPNPINVYGNTKLAGELAVKAVSKKCYIVRTSWVFGKGKENFFSSVHRSLTEGKKIRAITDVWASATYVSDLVSRVIEIISYRQYSTYHIVNSGLCTYYGFAIETAYILGLSDSNIRQLIEPVKLSDLQLNAKRPQNTPMRCLASEKIGLAPLRDWREDLEEYIQDVEHHSP